MFRDKENIVGNRGKKGKRKKEVYSSYLLDWGFSFQKKDEGENI